MKEFNEGKQAFIKNKPLESNPYMYDSIDYVQWAAGWLKADALENREYIGLGGSNTIQ